MQDTIADKIILECSSCGREYTAEQVDYLCPVCSIRNTADSPPAGVLKTLYNYAVIMQKSAGNLFRALADRGFIDLLPINSRTSLSYLRVGNTPLYQIDCTEKDVPPHKLLFKDDSQNPTYSYKDRASNLVSAIARERGINTIIVASTGNAGSSMAGIGTAQGQKIIILVPEKAPLAKLVQIAAYGAVIIPVKGSYDDAFELSMQVTAELGIYNRNTAFNPFTIEGKKTAALEIYAQMGEEIPDRIFVPVGDGCIIAGIYKGFEDLLRLGIINALPEIVAVRAENPNTIADSISVKIPRNYNLAEQYIQTYQGKNLTVTDEEILQAGKNLAAGYGLFSEPAAAAAYAGYIKYRTEYQIEENSRNVVLLTGSGLKDIKAVSAGLKLPESINPTLAEFKARLSLQR
ncbi:MAG: pyridoxal-phosphate dependent enzyme [Candidatus Cloacimonetes bacterium]|nr:pyridoxal-phosphate dependent enzyme [Candidatus Cloacimonadota bacterium]